MTTKSHYHLGLYLIRHNICQGSFWDCTAFLLGCIEPDLNPATYLKGTLYGERLRGHNYLNRKPYMEKLFQEISDTEQDGVLFYYRIGKLVHYLTDAFTCPHNSIFKGTIKEHVDYEKLLEQFFLEQLKDYTFKPQKWFRTELWQKVSGKHDRYMLEEAGIMTDTRFTMEIIPSVVMSLCSGYGVRLPMHLKEVRYENPFKI